MSRDTDRCNEARTQIKIAAGFVKTIHDDGFSFGLTGCPTGGETDEALANVMLAYRHLEDASMRLGKALQALDGGVSVYDKATTIGS